MNAYIIAIGDELLIGQVVDSNSARIAEIITSMGITVKAKVNISDQPDSILHHIDYGFSKADIVITTGGLGPTKDDITKKVIAAYFNQPLVMSETVLAHLEQMGRERGWKMNALNQDQALVPKNALVLHNAHGTAPGMAMEKDGKWIINLPGVPFEMQSLMEYQVKPFLESKFSLPVITHKKLLVAGIGESSLAELIADWEDNLPSTVSFAYLPSPGIIRLRMGITGESLESNQKVLNEQFALLKPILGNYLLGENGETLPELVAQYLLQNGKTVATAESCTGGYIAHLLTSIPGSSSWYKGSVIAYSNEIKTKILSVEEKLLLEHGAVSSAVVEKMALGVLNVMGTDYAIATSGVAGPSGGSPEKPVGTVWIAVAGKKGVKSVKYQFGNLRDVNIQRSANMGLLELLKFLRDL